MGNMQLIPFGKYKGQPIDVLQADKGYCDWLMAQDWFRERYPQMITLIVNNFGEPEDTPEHNALQAKFLDDDFAYNFLLKVYGKSHRNIAFDGVTFETDGWDVEISYSYVQHTITESYTNGKTEEDAIFSRTVFVEIKPNIGDDYPSVLRQMKSNKKGWFSEGILVYQLFTATGATEEQVKKNI